MFGAIFGDIIGSRYEGIGHKTKDYNFLFHKDSRYTDDTVITAAVCMAILLNDKPIDESQLVERAKEYAVQYKLFYAHYRHAGYGSGFKTWAREPHNYEIRHSYGNGAAMRVVPIGYAYNTIEQVRLQAEASCYFTHNCEESINAAQAVACAVFLAKNGESKEGIRKYITDNFNYDLNYTVDEIRKDYHFHVRCLLSVHQAIVAFLDSEDYESAVRNAVSLGGDADTMACIAGGIAEAFYGEIPEDIKNFCYSRLDYSIKSVATEFCRKFAISIYQNTKSEKIRLC
ncbi:MAG: ADP-ribosylglycohydrolase family protein [Ruminococcus sp.]|nr:ADP-ribosylglycohydrolase family protein [Ruminococcus sp.]